MSGKGKFESEIEETCVEDSISDEWIAVMFPTDN